MCFEGSSLYFDRFYDHARQISWKGRSTTQELTTVSVTERPTRYGNEDPVVLVLRGLIKGVVGSFIWACNQE